MEPTPERLAGGAKTYILATRPPFLSAALVGCLIGIASSSLAVSVDGVLALLSIVAAVLLHAGANVLNDAYDDMNGTDVANTRRIFPFTGGSRFIQNGVLSRAQTLRFGLLLMLLGALLGGVMMAMLEAHAAALLALVGLAGMVIGWGYSAPPLSLNSRGLGEPGIALAFGLLMVTGADLVQRGALDALPLTASVPFALLTTALLYINQFPDREADALAGKHHWVVRLGSQRARWGYLLMVTIAYAWLAGAVWAGLLPPWALLGLLGLPFSLLAARDLLRYALEPERLLPAIPFTILAMLLHGLGLALGLFIA